MRDIPLRGQQFITAAVVVNFVMAALHSLRVRGLRRTLLFMALGVGIPAASEYLVINHVRVLRHRVGLLIKGVPLHIALGWFNTIYEIFAVLESLLETHELTPATRRWALAGSAALTATSFDLLMDYAGLAQGMWEWNVDGRYAADVVGANGRRGVPSGNFVGWFVGSGAVVLLYLLLSGDEAGQSGGTGRFRSGRQAALLLAPYYLSGVVWAMLQRKWRYVGYSLLFPLVLALALVRQEPSEAPSAI